MDIACSGGYIGDDGGRNPPARTVFENLNDFQMETDTALTFPPLPFLDAVMRTHHFRSEVIYLARNLKVRTSFLTTIQIT